MGSVRYIDFATGVYVFDGEEMYIPNFDSNGLVTKDGAVVYNLLTNITQSSILTIRKEGDTNYIYYTDSNALMKVAMDESYPNNLGMAETVIKENIVTDYVKPVLDGNTFYYINSGYYNYIYKVDISNKDNKHSILGVRKDSDKAAYIKQVKEMNEEAREKHDKLIAEDLPAEELKKD